MCMRFDDDASLDDFECGDLGPQADLTFSNCRNLRRIDFTRPAPPKARGGSGNAQLSVSFAGLPDNEVEIVGTVRSIGITDGFRILRSGYGGDYRLRDMPNAMNAAVTCGPEIPPGFGDVEHHVMVLDREQQPETLIVGEGRSLRYLGMIGGKGVRRVVMHCQDGADRISLSWMPDLEVVEIMGTVRILDISRCPSIRVVSGTGAALLVDRESQANGVSLRGLWLDANVRKQISMQDLTLENLESCKDLGFSCLPLPDYVTRCEMEEALGIPMTEQSTGLSSQFVNVVGLVEALKSNPDQIGNLIGWFGTLRSLQEQYYLMRVLVSLSASGTLTDQMLVKRIRGHITWQNEENHSEVPLFVSARETYSEDLTPKGNPLLADRSVRPERRLWDRRISPLVSIGELPPHLTGNPGSADWAQSLFGAGEEAPEDLWGSGWVYPSTAHVPLVRLDLELFLCGGNGGKVPVRAGQMIRPYRSRRLGPDVGWMVSALSAFSRPCRSEDETERMGELMKLFFHYARSGRGGAKKNARVFDLIAYWIINTAGEEEGPAWLEYWESPVENPDDPVKRPDYAANAKHEVFPLRWKFRLELENAPINDWAKAAIACAVMQSCEPGEEEDRKWMVLLSGMMSSSELNVEEGRYLRIPATLGARAFREGHAEPLGWPFTETWRKRFERI